MDPFILGSLVVLNVLLGGALIAVSWRGKVDEGTRRDAEHRLLLGLLDRYKADSAVEVAQADAYRDWALGEQDRTDGVQVALAEEISNEHQAGWTGEIAQERAFLRSVNIDPDDDDAVETFNARHG